jgi:hypothetical protein
MMEVTFNGFISDSIWRQDKNGFAVERGEAIIFMRRSRRIWGWVKSRNSRAIPTYGTEWIKFWVDKVFASFFKKKRFRLP